MGTEFSIFDIDVVHPVSTKNECKGPKPVVSKFARRLAKGKDMEVRQRASQVNPTGPTDIDLSDIGLGGVRIFNRPDHLTPKKQNLLFEARNSKSGIIIAFAGLKTPTECKSFNRAPAHYVCV